MTKFTRSASGKYVVHGHGYEQLIGSRAQVMHGTAYKTSGGITKDKLMMNKSGRIVSKSKSRLAKTQKHLQKSGWKLASKGHFGPQKMSSHRGKRHAKSKKMRGGTTKHEVNPSPYSPLNRALMAGGSRRSRSRRGGMAYGGPLNPHPYDGQGVKTSGVDLQFVAGNAA
jgi:hypothetical protein